MSPGYGNKIYRDKKFPFFFVVFLALLGVLIFFMVLHRRNTSGSFDFGNTDKKAGQTLSQFRLVEPSAIPDYQTLKQPPPKGSTESGFGKKLTGEGILDRDSIPSPEAVTDERVRMQVRQFIENRDYRKALEMIRKLVVPGYLDIRDRGVCHYYLEEYESALNWLLQAFGIRNDDPVTLKLLAFTHYKLDNFDDSLSWIEKALEIENRQELLEFRDRLNRETAFMKGYTDRQAARFKIVFSRFEHGEIRHLVTDILKNATREIGRQMGSYPRRTITVVLYNEKAFFDITRVPAWVGGLYDGKIRIPIKGVEGREALLNRVLFHEYSHALIRDITPTCPLWIHEGLAEYFSSENQARIGQVFPLNQLEKRFPSGNPVNIILAYRESYSAVCELISRFGLYRIKDLLEVLAGGESFDTAFESVFCITFKAFMSDWGGQ